jgi:hypothetical protein
MYSSMVGYCHPVGKLAGALTLSLVFRESYDARCILIHCNSLPYMANKDTLERSAQADRAITAHLTSGRNPEGVTCRGIDSTSPNVFTVTAFNIQTKK